MSLYLSITGTFIRRLSMIAWVNIVLNRTVVVDNDWCFDNQWGSNLPSQSELHDISWWYYILCGSCIIQWIVSSSFEQLRPVWAALKYRRDQKRIKEIKNLRMKCYMINSIVQTILLTAASLWNLHNFNTKTCKLIFITFSKISKFTEN